VRVHIRRIPRTDPPTSEWPADAPVPRIGEEVTYADGSHWWVAHVIWYPEGPDTGDDGEPYVHVVLHQQESL